MKLVKPVSPLRRLTLNDSNTLTTFQTIGLVTDLAINHSERNQIDVNETLSRVLQAIELGAAKVFLDDEQRPYGYASWTFFSDNKHQSILSGEASELRDPELFFRNYKPENKNLWFLDLISPFSTPLFMYRALKQELKECSTAHLFQPEGDVYRSRRVW